MPMILNMEHYIMHVCPLKALVEGQKDVSWQHGRCNFNNKWVIEMDNTTNLTMIETIMDQANKQCFLKDWLMNCIKAIHKGRFFFLLSNYHGWLDYFVLRLAFFIKPPNTSTTKRSHKHKHRTKPLNTERRIVGGRREEQRMKLLTRKPKRGRSDTCIRCTWLMEEYNTSTGYFIHWQFTLILI